MVVDRVAANPTPAQELGADVEVKGVDLRLERRRVVERHTPALGLGLLEAALGRVGAAVERVAALLELRGSGG